MKLKWSIDQLYFYLVCFVMLITIIIGITSLVQASISLLIPLPDSGIGRLEPFPYEPIPRETEDSKTTLPQEIIERELQNMKEFNQNRSRTVALHSALLQLFRGIAQILVAFPIYLYHWRKIPEFNM